jgi:hypothetical protein
VILALDPSVRSPGVALFDEGRLLTAGRVTVKKLEESDGARWLRVAWEVISWLHKNRGAAELVETVVFEKPQIYTMVKSKGDPNDLIGLAGVSMAVVGLIEVISRSKESVTVLSPTPAEWIGQVAKTTTGSAKESPRARRILSRLDVAELALVPDQHDAIDAVGLGLFALGRLTVKRVFSNGRD